MAGGDRADVERLRAYWDGVVQGDPTVPDDLDPGTAAMVQQLHAWYRPPLPDPAFHVRLQEELMHSAAVSPLGAVPKPHGLPVPLQPAQTGGLHRVPRAGCRDARGQPGRMLGYLASAALVVVTLVAAYLAFGPSRPAGTPTGPSANLPALLAPATPAPGAMTEEVVLETTLFGLAYDVADDAGLDPSRPDPAPSRRERHVPGPMISASVRIRSSPALLTINLTEDVPVTPPWPAPRVGLRGRGHPAQTG